MRIDREGFTAARPDGRLPRVRRLALASLAAAAGAAALAASAGGAPLVLYTSHDAAVAIDGGVSDTYRQAPARESGRWPGSRRLGKVSGSELAGQSSANGMAATLRQGWRREGGALVGVDEIRSAQWTPGAAARLQRAMIALGPDARRVVFYVGSSVVEQIGRRDPRRALPTRLARLLDAMSRGRAAYLQTYRGNLTPYPEREMATHPTRWRARWPVGRGTLHLLVGPDGGIGQHALWARIRSTRAGRELLANGPGAYGLRSASDGRAWLSAYRGFLGAPTVAPDGDYAVPIPGGLELRRAGARAVSIRLGRRGRAVVRIARRGSKRWRAIRKLSGPTRGRVRVRLPRDVRPGRYRVTAVLVGDGLKDRKHVRMVVRRRR